VRFIDVADSLGVTFRHTNGSSGRLYLAETMGSGCAFLDYDGDGRLDLFLVNSSRLPGFTRRGPFYPALYQQRADGRFEEVTREAGLAIDCYGMGVAVGDYDNDGDPDLYLTAYGGCHLFRNNRKRGPGLTSDGGPAFSDVTRVAGVSGPAMGTSAAWFDYDRDGFLDLFVCNYCRWSPASNRSCGDSSGPFICGPQYYGGAASVLYHNNRDGTFTDITRRAGVGMANGKALGIVVWDLEGDGWPDFAVANDTVPNWLYRNNRDGTFTELSVEAGIAYDQNGRARAGMGIDTADYDHNGGEALLIGNNSTEGLGLYRPEPLPSDSRRGGDVAAAPPVGGSARPGWDGHFTDVAEEAGLFQPSLLYSTFGALFTDVDLDGFADVVTANGHVNEQVARLGGSIRFEECMQLFHNVPGDRPGARRFHEEGESAGEGITTPRVGRGLAMGDFDGDGDADLLVTANNGRAALLRNEGGNRNHWLALRLRGTKSNREGLGTRVVLRAGGETQTGWVRSGSSYCSDSEHVARFGLGRAAQADSIELHWPSGTVQTLRDVRADQVLEVTEPAS
jgi:hypothetical protein